MAPYDPPIGAWFSAVDVSHLGDDRVLALIGKGGRGFYKLTNQMGIDYLWWNRDTKQIEIWAFNATSVHRAFYRISRIVKKMHENPPRPPDPSIIVDHGVHTDTN